MYKLLLITKYLRRKLAPLFAALAVTLCTAMVIIVISVMGGFLEMMRGSVRKLTGDVMMRGDMTGFAHYQQILDDLRKMPEVAGATPMIQSYGLAKLNGRIKTVEIVGIDPTSFDAVTGFAGTLHWNTANLQEQYERSMGPRENLTPAQRAEIDTIKEQWGKMGLDAAAMAMKPPATWSRGDSKGEDAAVPGIAMWNRRDSEGHYGFDARIVGNRMTLTMLRVQQKGMIDQPAVGEFTVVNEFKSGLYEIDANRIFIKLDLMQKKLAMDEAEEANPDTGEPTGKKIPARVTEIMVRAKPGVPVELLRDKIDEYTNDLALKHPDLALYPAMTWKERHARLLGAVEKEKFLLTILFAIISVVAVAMIAVIFYMIVLEKTRDIGVLRALGASRSGIASIFLGYGLAIGVIGSGMGLALAWVVVANINEIQDSLAAQFGFKMWDPQIYYFDKIPAALNWSEVGVILLFAVTSSVVGSVVPALLAARVDPVEAIRYE